MGSPTIYPTGVTIYDPEKCFNGYTLYDVEKVGTVLVDMNGCEVKIWDKLRGFPCKLLKGGQVFGQTGERNERFGYQDDVDLVQVDWDGNIVWRFNKHELIQDDFETPQWMARQHHDCQREGNPVGYYVPDMECKTDGGNTLLLCHRNIVNSKISARTLCDDVFLEVDWNGNIMWEWQASDHYEEFGFSEAQKNVIYREPNMHKAGGGVGDWLHINCMSELGPNKWYDAGDERFHPRNIIFDSREASFLAIISRETGKIVWKVGPNYQETEQLKAIGNIIGPHLTHMIPQGLPGAGNILLFDNGGGAGYGVPDANSKKGLKTMIRDYSRVLEINPVTLQIVWQYGPAEAGLLVAVDANHLYSPLVSGAQRLPNGNTLITIGIDGRIIEVTRSGKMVWEYQQPYNEAWGIYRAYRYPYEYVPQAKHSEEIAILPVDKQHFRVPGAVDNTDIVRTGVAGTMEYPVQTTDSFCVATADIDEELF